MAKKEELEKKKIISKDISSSKQSEKDPIVLPDNLDTETADYFGNRLAIDGKKIAQNIGKILEEAGLINEEMTKKAIDYSKEAGISVKSVLTQQGLVSEEDFLEAIASHMGMETIDLTKQQIEKEAIEMVPAKVAKKYGIIPVRIVGNGRDRSVLFIAIKDPLNIEAIDDLQKFLPGIEVKGMVASEKDIEYAIKKHYDNIDVSTLYQDTALEEDVKESGGDTFIDSYSHIDLDETEVSETPIVKYIDLLFKHAIHDRASDIHIEPTKTGINIRFRIDGLLQEIPPPSRKYFNAIISRIKVLSGMDLSEKRVPQDGRIMLNFPDKKLDLRVSVIPAIFGECVVMRILDASTLLLGLEDVGFLPDSIELFKKIIKSPTGIILMTGPTGCGKTTTLYAALSTLNTPDRKIVTLENPVEYQIGGINQMQTHEEIGLDFAMGLRTVLRQSPDIILIGEMRDLETAEIGIRAALTGHLVFSTLHTNDAPSAATRLIDMGIKPFLVASSVHAIIAQRLIRRICPHCKVEYTPHPEEVIEMGYSPEEYRDKPLYKGTGCERCNDSGYRGRTAIHEIFILNSALRSMIIRSIPSSKLKKEAVKMGMKTLRMDGWEKILLGITTTEEVLRITQEE